MITKADLEELTKALDWTVKNCPNAPYVPVKRELVDLAGLRTQFAEVYTKGWQHAKSGNGSLRDATIDAVLGDTE